MPLKRLLLWQGNIVQSGQEWCVVRNKLTGVDVVLCRLPFNAAVHNTLAQAWCDKLQLLHLTTLSSWSASCACRAVIANSACGTWHWTDAHTYAGGWTAVRGAKNYCMPVMWLGCIAHVMSKLHNLHMMLLPTVSFHREYFSPCIVVGLQTLPRPYCSHCVVLWAEDVLSHCLQLPLLTSWML